MKKKLGFFENHMLIWTAKKDAENRVFEAFESDKKYIGINTDNKNKKVFMVSAFMLTEMNKFAYARDRFYKEHRCIYKSKTEKRRFPFRFGKFADSLCELDKRINDNIRNIEIARHNCESAIDEIEEKCRILNKDNTASEITAMCNYKKAECQHQYEEKINTYKSNAVALLDEKKRLIDKMSNCVVLMFRRRMLRVNTYYRWAHKTTPALPAVCADGQQLLQISSIDLLGKLSDAEKDIEAVRTTVSTV